MAVTIDATVGGASANSFCTLAEAVTYLEGKMPSPATWDAAAPDTQHRALVSATRWLTAKDWQGLQASGDQALAWPRQYVVDPRDPDGIEFDTDVIPQLVKDATAELAALMVAAGSTDLALGDPNVNVRRNKVDVLEKEYFEPYLRAEDTARFETVQRLIAPLLLATGGPSFRVARA